MLKLSARTTREAVQAALEAEETALDPTVLARRGENVYTDPSSASRMRGYEGHAPACSMLLERCRRFLISRRAALCTSMEQPG